MSRPALERRITAWGIWALAVNGMIGAGIFAVPAGAAALTGAWSPLVFLACAALLGLIILCFAEISSHFRATGGPALYVGTAFGRFAGFQTGWTVYVSRVTAYAANVNLMIASLGFFWAPAAEGPWRIALIAGVIGLLTVINILGTRQAMGSVGLLTVAKFLPLIAVAVGGLFWIDANGLTQTGAGGFPEIASFGAAALLVVYAFVGWESAVIPAGESRDPARDMPRALIWALVSVALLYVVIQWVSVSVLGDDLATSETALMDVAGVLFGPWGATLLAVGIIVSIGGNIACTTVSAPRLTYALAREGTLPRFLGAVHPRFHTPAASILVFALIGLALAVWGEFVWLAAMSALVRILVYVACIASMPRIRKTQGHAQGSFRLPLGWTIPVLAVLGSLVLITSVSLTSLIATAVFLGIGAGLYFAFRREPEPEA
jgi:amino acid transporter